VLGVAGVFIIVVIAIVAIGITFTEMGRNAFLDFIGFETDSEVVSEVVIVQKPLSNYNKVFANCDGEVIPTIDDNWTCLTNPQNQEIAEEIQVSEPIPVVEPVVVPVVVPKTIPKRPEILFTNGYYHVKTIDSWYGDMVDGMKKPRVVRGDGETNVPFDCYVDSFQGTSTYFAVFRNDRELSITVDVVVGDQVIQTLATERNKGLILEGSC